jgi:hypothetical protein
VEVLPDQSTLASPVTTNAEADPIFTSSFATAARHPSDFDPFERFWDRVERLVNNMAAAPIAMTAVPLNASVTATSTLPDDQSARWPRDAGMGVMSMTTLDQSTITPNTSQSHLLRNRVRSWDDSFMILPSRIMGSNMQSIISLRNHSSLLLASNSLPSSNQFMNSSQATLSTTLASQAAPPSNVSSRPVLSVPTFASKSNPSLMISPRATTPSKKSLEEYATENFHLKQTVDGMAKQLEQMRQENLILRQYVMEFRRELARLSAERQGGEKKPVSVSTPSPPSVASQTVKNPSSIISKTTVDPLGNSTSTSTTPAAMPISPVFRTSQSVSKSSKSTSFQSKIPQRSRSSSPNPPSTTRDKAIHADKANHTEKEQPVSITVEQISNSQDIQGVSATSEKVAAAKRTQDETTSNAPQSPDLGTKELNIPNTSNASSPSISPSSSRSNSVSRPCRCSTHETEVKSNLPAISTSPDSSRPESPSTPTSDANRLHYQESTVASRSRSQSPKRLSSRNSLA